MTKNKVIFSLIIFGIVLRLVLLIWADGTMIDDAYISLRYAQNLIDRNGLVYNERQNVLGITGPLYAVWIAILLLLFRGIEAGYVIGVANIAFFALTALALFRVVSELGNKTATMVVLLFATYLRFVDNSIIGMETPLFLFGMVTSLLLLRQNRIEWLSILLALLILVRPEGVLWILSILIVLAIRDQKLDLPRFLPGVFVLLLWIVFSLYYYGSPIPNSLYAKSGWIVPHYYKLTFYRITSLLASLALLELPDKFSHLTFPRMASTAVVIVSIAPFFIGSYRLFRKKSIVFVFPLLFFFYIIFYLFGKGRLDFSWYGIPSGLAYLITTLFGISLVVQRLGGKPVRDKWFRRLVTPLAVVLIIVSVLTWEMQRLPYFRLLRESYEKAGEYIDRNADKDVHVLVAEIGMIGYRAKRSIYDLGGIVSPEILEYYVMHNWHSTKCDVLKEFEPDFVVFDSANMDHLFASGDIKWIDENYEIVAEFPIHTVLKKMAPGTTL